MDDDSSFLDYIPYIGDVYRIAKLGATIGKLFSEDNPNDYILKQMLECLEKVPESKTIEEISDIINTFGNLINQFQAGKKKYQDALCGLFTARALHIKAYYMAETSENPLEDKSSIEELFDVALETCSSVLEIKKTIFTDNCDLIDTVREEIQNEITSIKSTRKSWRKYCTDVDKKMHPWKYRLRWIIPLCIIVIFIFFLLLSKL